MVSISFVRIVTDMELVNFVVMYVHVFTIPN